MCRQLFALLVLATITGWSVADDPKKPDYYPLAKGNKWEYEMEPLSAYGGKKQTMIREVTKVEMKNGRLFVTVMSGTDPNRLSPDELSIDDKGVFEQIGGGGGVKWDPPYQILAFPLTSGAKWARPQEKVGEGVGAEFVVKPLEEIEVPAGKFKALPVEEVIKLGTGRAKKVYWYANGVGLVKQTYEIEGFTGKWELKKFTPGK